MARSKIRSPLKDKPLRVPGQSIDEQRRDVAEDMLLMPAMLAAAIAVLALNEWYGFFVPREPMPWLFTAVFLLALVFFVYRVFRTRARIRELTLGRDGERVVGQHLERLGPQGYQVFHDVIGEGFNIDHVLVGPTGIYTVETKTYSRPARSHAVVTFDGERLAIGNWEADRNPVIQARAQAGWLRELLRESSSRDFPVMPVIVFPGWFIKSAGRPARPIWVLNPKALPEYLKRREVVLTREDVQLAAFHLSRFIRSEELRRAHAAA